MWYDRLRRLSVGAKANLLLILIFVPLAAGAMQVARSTRDDMRRSTDQFTRAADVQALAQSSLVLILLQESITQSTLIDLEKIVEDAPRKIAAYDETMEIFERLRTHNEDPELQALVTEIVRLDKEELRLADTEVLEALGEGQLEIATKLYFTRYEAIRVRYEALVRKLIQRTADSSRIAAAQLAADRENSYSNTVISLLTGIALVMLLMLYGTRLISHNLRHTTEMLEAVAAGDMSRRCRVKSLDEFGRMGLALNQAVEHIFEATRQKVECMLEVVSAAAQGDLTREIAIRGSDPLGQLGEALASLLADLRADIREIAESSINLASSSTEMSGVSESLHGSAEGTSAQIGQVTDSSRRLSGHTQAVAVATEELRAGVKDMSHRARESAQVASTASHMTRSTASAITRLKTSSEEIGGVVKLISSIASQTRLLALNATIEAARAGDAGRGFAVVAKEVRDLASSSAKATGEISERIEAIQKDVQSCQQAMDELDEIIRALDAFQADISHSSMAQLQMTDEIARNITEAATDAARISSHMGEVSSVSTTASLEATRIHDSAVALAGTAAVLKQLVNRFVLDRPHGTTSKAQPTPDELSRPRARAALPAIRAARHPVQTPSSMI